VLWFLAQKFHYLIDYSLASYTSYYWPRRAGLILHLTGGVLAITAGLVQIWLGLTNRVSTLHRVLGKVYGTGVLIGSLGGFYLAMDDSGSSTVQRRPVHAVRRVGAHHRHGAVCNPHAPHRAASPVDAPQLHGNFGVRDLPARL